MMEYTHPMRVWLLGAGLVVAGVAAEADTAVVVTATRDSQPIDAVPASIDLIDRARLADGQLQVNLSESLVSVPGVVAQSRQNYAQDLQISVRGFGARSSFGVRGLRLYSDGIPGTMPDGQGQFAQFDLGSAGRIEVLRGPFSVLYGNSSGGVVSLFTADGPSGQALDATISGGSYGEEREALKAAGTAGITNYVVDLSHFQTDGYRAHSRAERNLFNTKVRFDLAGGATLTLIGNAIQTPFVQDPLGLTHLQRLTDPTQAGSGAVSYNTRKSLEQEQVGAIYHRQLGEDGELEATAYGGHRHTVQFQSLPASAQGSPNSLGGVIDLGRGYGGLDVHASELWLSQTTPLHLTIGASYDRLDEARRGYLNFVGTTFGVPGALRRDQNNQVYDLDEYLEARWEPSAQWRLMAGVRNSTVDVSSNDHRAVATVSPVTGVRFNATNPVAGVTFLVSPSVHVYGAFGRGFETPTLNDLAYRSTDGSVPGLNLGLKPAHSDNYEVGVKATHSGLLATAALFDTKTHDDLAIAANSNGRSVYQNIGQTERKGVELSVDGALTRAWTAHLAYTYLSAKTLTSYSTCVTTPCVQQVIPAGNRLPAVPMNSVYGSLTWQPVSHVTLTGEMINRSQIYVDDRNSDAANGYWLFNLHATVRQEWPHWRLSESVRVDNVADRNYVGTVIVNESNARFFEPSPGRTAYVVLNAQCR